MLSVIGTGALLLAVVKSMTPAHFPFSSGPMLYICERVTSWGDEITEDPDSMKKCLQNWLCVIEIIFSPGNPKCVLIRNEFISKAKAALDGDPNDFLST